MAVSEQEESSSGGGSTAASHIGPPSPRSHNRPCNVVRSDEWTTGGNWEELVSPNGGGGTSSGGTSTSKQGASSSYVSTDPCLKDENSEICFSCGDVIVDRYILQVACRSWHSQCLRCCVCRGQLDSQTSCFIRDEALYCKLDYTKMFGSKCYKCTRNISPADWVRKAKDQIYHLACFACNSCKRQLSTGEEFGIIDGQVLCKSHFLELRDGTCSSSDDSGELSENTNFQIDSNPDGQDLERIAQITGLSKRVTQVWFQNCRARQKKYTMPCSKRSISTKGLSPVPKDQCSSTPPAVDLHVMYSSFRAQTDGNNTDDLSQDSIGSNYPMRGEA
ncbi:LHX6_8 [Lepeophtheirus salmonis]|uniref:LHX6_8 n=1 Tax=Lepeophtheirus salmonis TaxID=72036 RepID=A0A7R8D4M5_LEPSM|nr:LHX6_8 [Lepeophtheirus salmonis]CAF3027291.1 LHX6_8 [Lepeophtheirus salmonis]